MVLVAPVKRRSVPAGTDENHWTMQVKAKKFSKKRRRNNVQFVKFDKSHQVVLYPDGYNELTAGSVSVALSATWRFHIEDVMHVAHAELTCVVAVVDAEGTRRYPQSFSICRDTPKNSDLIFFIDNYISREFLLKKSRELLPKNTLTLHMDMVAKIRHTEYYRRFYVDSIDREYENAAIEVRTVASVPTIYLALDSPFGKRLAEESWYFERLLDIPMEEKITKRVRIPDEERCSLDTIKSMFYDPDLLIITSISAIFGVYATGKKYFIESVIDTCRCWLSLCICNDNASSIAELADEYDDHDLKEIIEDFQRAQDDNVPSHRFVTSGVWTCEHFPSKSWQIKYKLNDGGDDDNFERDQFDFYF